jgi:hypothetical protein
MIRRFVIVACALMAAASLYADEGIKKLPGGVRVDRAEMAVYASGEVVFREGPLEFLACSRGTKEHESVVALDCKPFVLNIAVLSLNVTPGKPVQQAEANQMPQGPPFIVTIRWTDKKGKVHEVPAGTMVRRLENKGDLGDIQWVYTGSSIGKSEVGKRKVFMADETGAVISVWHEPTTMFDLKLAEADSDETYEANTEAIPPLGTKVEVVLKPAPKKGAEVRK